MHLIKKCFIRIVWIDSYQRDYKMNVETHVKVFILFQKQKSFVTKIN